MERSVRRNSIAEQVSATAKEPHVRQKQEAKPQDLYPTGSTMLNLACSDSHRGGFKLGTIVTLPGSSSSGKSMLAETALAEGAHDARFAGYELVRDDAEAAYSFDTRYLFGDAAADRIKEPPLGCSNTIQQFSSNILNITKKENKPVIYVLDSLDSLSSDEELEKEMRKALAAAKSAEAAQKIAGSYGTEKAKIMGQTLRMINQELERTKSLLMIVQQIRQNMDASPFSSPYKTSGGEAPFFYSTHQVWLNKVGTLKAKERKVGTQVKASVKKNKLTGKLRDVSFDIWYSYGVDDLRSMIDFLIEEGRWKKSGTSVNAVDLGLSGTYFSTGGGTLVSAIEESGLERDIRKLVEVVWNEIEESLVLDRKPRF